MIWYEVPVIQVYLLDSWWVLTKLWWIACKDVSALLIEIQYAPKYLRSVCFTIYHCTWKLAFLTYKYIAIYLAMFVLNFVYVVTIYVGTVVISLHICQIRVLQMPCAMYQILKTWRPNAVPLNIRNMSTEGLKNFST